MKDLRHEVGGNLQKEKVISNLISQFEGHVLKTIKKIEQFGAFPTGKGASWGKQQVIWKIATELDQFIIGQQSRVSLGDYTLNDVGSLFANIGEHRKLVVGLAH